MALSKSFITENGIHTEYHKISEVIVNTSRDTEKESKLFIKVDSYVSQAYRTTASAPASARAIAASAVAIFPQTISIFGYFGFTLLRVSITFLE